jgi:peptidoglycan hydrolase-like protein with peptidoglycan-binding domain
MNKQRIIIGAVAAAAVGVGTMTAVGLVGSSDNTTTATAARAAVEPSASFETATVRRDSLSSEREFNATVSHGDQWTINTAAAGTITGSRDVGTVVEDGEWLVRVDDKPVTVASGDMPLYRELYEVNTRSRDRNGNRLTHQTGLDVTQLQTFLADAGFDAGDQLEIDGRFGGYTEQAVKDWQESVGLPVTGRVDNSQMVFEPEPVRLAAEKRVGDSFATIDVTQADAKVLVETSTRDRSALLVGTTIDIDVNGSILSGIVSDQEQVTGQDGSTIWRTTITADGQLPSDVSTATVTVTQVVAEDVLFVPVSALLALSEGGFAVEVPDGAATTLIRVDVGEVLDGYAEIQGDIAEGDTVVVPT